MNNGERVVLSLAQWIAFTEAAAASTDQRLDVENDPTAALALRSGLSGLRRQLEMLRMTDQELAAARAQADPTAEGTDLQRIDAISAEVYRRSKLTGHERIAEAVGRRRMREASPS